MRRRLDALAAVGMLIFGVAFALAVGELTGFGAFRALAFCGFGAVAIAGAAGLVAYRRGPAPD